MNSSLWFFFFGFLFTPFLAGFERGVLTPWFQDWNFTGAEAWNVTNSNSHTGAFSATDVGNKELKQTFGSVPASTIFQVSFWAKHTDPVVTGLAFDFFYSNASVLEFSVNTTGTGWNFFYVTAQLDPTKNLVGFSVFGNSGGALFLTI